MSFSFKSVCSNIIPTNTYKVLVTDMKFAAGGSKNILVTITILEGPYAKRVHTENISEKAYSFRLMPLLKACKVDIDRQFKTAEELYKFGFASAKGKIIMIDMGVRTYNGQEYNSVTSFYPVPDSTTSVDDVAESFGLDKTPEVKNETNIMDVVEASDNINEYLTGTTTPLEEPELDVNLEDIESPF